MATCLSSPSTHGLPAPADDYPHRPLAAAEPSSAPRRGPKKGTQAWRGHTSNLHKHAHVRPFPDTPWSLAPTASPARHPAPRAPRLR